MDTDFFELLLIIVIISISLYLIGVFVFGFDSDKAATSSISVTGAIAAANASIDSSGSTSASNGSIEGGIENSITGGAKKKYDVYKDDESIFLASPDKIPKHYRPDNLEDISMSDSVVLNKLNKFGGKTYDEYDDNDLLVELDPNYIDSFENIVVDGNNFIYKLRDSIEDKGSLTPAKYTTYLEKTIDILTDIVKDKGIFIVLKDPEGANLEDFLKFVGEKNIKSAYKKFFEGVFDKYPNVRFVVAFGKAKHRDDYAAILTSDLLSDAVLLSRDRYRDVSDMSSDGIKMIAYGKGALAINKKLNKPFTYVTRGVVRNNLVGYTFSKKRKQGFYEKTVNKRSVASDVVLVLRI